MRIGIVAALVLSPGLAFGEPSRTFTQELAHAAQPGRVYIDLYNSTGTTTLAAPSLLRIGTPPGEIQVGLNEIGYKGTYTQNIASYFSASFSSKLSHMNMRIGAVFDWPGYGFLMSFNPELVRTEGINTLALNGAMLIPLNNGGSFGKFHFAMDASLLDSRNAHTALALGLRWLPDPALTIDLLLIGDKGQAGSNIDMATPTALRVNWRLL